MGMQCENECGKFNTKNSKPVRRYYDDQGGKGLMLTSVKNVLYLYI